MHPLIAQGELAERNGDYIAAVGAYAAAIADGDPSVAGDALFHLGRVAWRQSRHDEALSFYEKARALGERNNDELWARAENGIGAIHYNRGEYAQARASYRVAYDRSSDDIMRGKVLLNLGVIANIEGDYATARDHYQRSREMLLHAGDDVTLAMVLHNLGMLHADIEEWDEAADAYRQCLEISEASGNRQMVGNVLLNRSELLIARGRMADAVVHCERAIRIFTELGDVLGRGEALRWQGVAHHQQGDHASAKRVLMEAQKIARKLKAELLLAEVSRELGLVHATAGDVPNARKLLGDALERFRKLGANREIEDVEGRIAALK